MSQRASCWSDSQRHVWPALDIYSIYTVYRQAARATTGREEHRQVFRPTADRQVGEQTDRWTSGKRAILRIKVSVMHSTWWAAHVGHVTNAKCRNVH